VIDPKELIKVERVSFRYGPIPVLEEVSFSVAQGDFVAMLGPNGSGKTTLVKLILGLLRPAEGRVVLMGKPVEQFQAWSEIGYVPQKATQIDPLFPASVREVVAMAFLPGRIGTGDGKREKDRDKAVSLALERVGMIAFRDRPIGSLSGGQQQRVFIARAIVNAPQLLFLDEPTAGVDAVTQGLFYEMLHRLNEEQRITIMLVTHDIGIVNKHVTKVACLNQKLVFHGSHLDFCRSEAFKTMLANGHLVSHTH
jgi:zinc transport system ATP-binding protein